MELLDATSESWTLFALVHLLLLFAWLRNPERVWWKLGYALLIIWVPPAFYFYASEDLVRQVFTTIPMVAAFVFVMRKRAGEPVLEEPNLGACALDRN